MAVLGDVHANLAALEAVLAAVRAMGIPWGLVTGDIVGRGPEAEECVTVIRALGWPCVQGNTDCDADPRLSEASRQWLGGLPPARWLTVGGIRVYAVHESTPLEWRRALEGGAHCLVSGHTHVASVERVGRLLVLNPGSVGEGTPEDLRPAWAWLSLADDAVEATLARCEAPAARPRIPRGLQPVS
jgi:putative phosphoesterase